MKQNIIPAIRLTMVCIVLFIVVYPALIWGIAQAAPAKGEGEKVMVNNKVVGYALEGQSFTADKYFWGRPSAAGYNAAASAGSNKGPSNPDYLATVQERIDSFMAHNPGVQQKDIPSELVTASGSGLDPDISVQAAWVQVPRIVAARKVDKARIAALIEQQKQQSVFNGIQKVNVLQLNIQLNQLQ